MNIEPYFKIAYEEALKSPCSRRKYGSVIVYPGLEVNHIAAHNSRVGKCCNSMCVRDKLGLLHGERTEAGGEVHSEIAALVNRPQSKGKGFFILVGLNSKTLEPIPNPRPCHSCALALKYAGFQSIWVKDEDDNIVLVSLSSIIEEQENVLMDLEVYDESAYYDGTTQSDFVA